MADLNGIGGTSFGGLSSSVSAVVKWWDTEAMAPADGGAYPTTAPLFHIRATTWNGGSAEVQLQVATEPTFAAPVHDSTVTQAHNAEQTRTVTGLVNGTLYFWRARSGDGTLWGAWTPTMTLTIQVDSGKAFQYATVNVGVTLISDPDAHRATTVNVGVMDTRQEEWPAYLFANVGVQVTLTDEWPAYLYAYVTSDPPMPHLWFLRPPSGREGDGVEVVGWGFGDTPEQYSAGVEIELEPGVWTAMQTVTYQTFPATADGYNDNRVLNQATGEIDPQHTVIAVVVPPGTEPPGYPVRVRTVTP